MVKNVVERTELRGSSTWPHHHHHHQHHYHIRPLSPCPQRNPVMAFRLVAPLSLLLPLLLLAASAVAAASATPGSHVATEPDTEYETVGREPRWVTVPPPSPGVQQQQGRVSVALPSLTTSTTTTAQEGQAAPHLSSSSASDKNNSVANITGQLGGSAFLPCTTHHSMERQVSWVRRRDFHILTSGTLTYTKEGRFQVHHQDGSTQWTLAIKYLELDDAGIYECHISTGSGVVAQLVRLEVVEPRAVIPGSGEHHVQAGSTISLVCYIEQSPEPPQYIFWYHNSRMINYDRERGGVSVHMEEGRRVRTKLSVSGATPADSGNYTCDAANTRAASITVYVTEANHIAAIQPRAMDGAGCLESPVALLGLLLTMALLGGPTGLLH